MSLCFEKYEGTVPEALSAALSGGLPHAILLEGEPGSGTDWLAAFLAQAAVCVAEGDKPCGQCPGCRKARAGSHPDIFTLNGDENSRAFPVDAIRQIRADAYIRPNEAPSRVFVLLGVQNMSEISQNALLKILEEPPKNVLFLLTSVSAAALLPTVRSRLQVFSVPGGSLPQNWGIAEKMAHAVTDPGGAELLFTLAEPSKSRDSFRELLKQLSLLFRDALVRRSGGKAMITGLEETAALLSSRLTRRSLMRMEEATEMARRALVQNVNTALLAAAYCAEIRSATEL